MVLFVVLFVKYVECIGMQLDKSIFAYLCSIIWF